MRKSMVGMAFGMKQTSKITAIAKKQEALR